MSAADRVRGRAQPWPGLWPLLERAMVGFAAAGVDGLARVIRRTLGKTRYRGRLINGCLAGTGLAIGPW